MKTTCSLIMTLGLFAVLGSASTLLEVPVASPDGQALDPLSPGLGAQVFAIPGSVWQVDFNDNLGNTAPGIGGDFDFDDAMALLTFGPGGLDTLTGGLATLNYISSNTADQDYVQVLGGPWISASQSESVPIVENGQVVTVHMLDVSDFEQYSSGPADLNPGGAVAAWVADSGNTTPEPAGWMLILVAAVAGLIIGVSKGLRLRSSRR